MRDLSPLPFDSEREKNARFAPHVRLRTRAIRKVAGERRERRLAFPTRCQGFYSRRRQLLILPRSVSRLGLAREHSAGRSRRALRHIIIIPAHRSVLVSPTYIPIYPLCFSSSSSSSSPPPLLSRSVYSSRGLELELSEQELLVRFMSVRALCWLRRENNCFFVPLSLLLRPSQYQYIQHCAQVSIHCIPTDKVKYTPTVPR